MQLLMQSWPRFIPTFQYLGETLRVLTSLGRIVRLRYRWIQPCGGPSCTGGNLRYSGNEQGALNAVAKALSLDPHDPKTLVWQAQIYTRLNRWPDAEQTLRRVLKEHPNYWLAYNELGFGLEEQGRYQEAIVAFRAASLAAPKNSWTLSNLGAEYIQVGQYEEAMETLKRSAALDPALAQTAAFTSLALRYQGKYDEALRFARKAVQLNAVSDRTGSSSAIATFHWAIIRAKPGRPTFRPQKRQSCSSQWIQPTARAGCC